jgi:transcription-repair coupling factor (superfamily II helicase)
MPTPNTSSTRQPSWGVSGRTGSILGTAQSGHISAIGFDLYCQLLKQAVAQLKGEKAPLRLEVEVRLDFVASNEAEPIDTPSPNNVPSIQRVPAYIPTKYISDSGLRIQAYRNVTEVTTHEQLDRLRHDWRDRFGQFPPAVENLLLITQIKLAAAKKNLTRVEVRDRKLMLTRRGDFVLVGGKFPRLVAPTIREQLPEILDLVRKL